MEQGQITMASGALEPLAAVLNRLSLSRQASSARGKIGAHLALPLGQVPAPIETGFVIQHLPPRLGQQQADPAAGTQ